MVLEIRFQSPRRSPTDDRKSIRLIKQVGTALGAILTRVLILGATYNRMNIEEQVLLQRFGEEYRKYMQHTWKIFPGW